MHDAVAEPSSQQHPNKPLPLPRSAAMSAALAAAGTAALRDLLAQIGQLFGDASARAARLRSLGDPATATDRRREILQAFARAATPEALPVVLRLLGEPELRRDAIRALAAFEDPAVQRELLARYPTLHAGERAEAILTLSARRASAQALLGALRDNEASGTEASHASP